MFSWVLSKKCLLCLKYCYHHYDLCNACEQELPWLSTSFYPNLLAFQKVIALFHYDLPINYMITRLKFQHDLIYANLFGALLCKKIIGAYQNENLPEVIIPVPLHPKRLHERGFNQALEIAKPISRKLNVAINHTACTRRINTLPQSSLSASMRQHNVRHAFSLVKNISQKHIALIDDVITTGHTTTELAQTFIKAGVEKVDVWCCARTTPEQHS